MAAWVLLIFLVFFVSAIQTALNIANINSTEHYCHSGMQHKSDILGEYEIFLANATENFPLQFFYKYIKPIFTGYKKAKKQL